MLEQVAEIGSTSEALKLRAAAGYTEEVALLALRQTAGHGQQGRPWRSLEGNLHLSVLLRPGKLEFPGHWSLLAAVALADAVRGSVPEGAAIRLKWPNDVLLGRAKLAGILLEAGFENGAGPWLVIGFGVNLATAPDDIGRAAACIADVAPAPKPAAFAALLLGALVSWRVAYDREGFQPIRNAWLSAGPSLGAPLTVVVGERRIEGALAGIGPDGTLLLDGPGGIVALASGVVA